MSVGQNIKKYRSGKGLTHAQLAVGAGVPASTIYMWETGRIAPTSEQVDRLAEILEVSPDDIAERPRAVRASEPNVTRLGGDDGPSPAASSAPASAPAFDLALVTRVYNVIRDGAPRADAVELATARSILAESLKLVDAAIARSGAQ